MNPISDDPNRFSPGSRLLHSSGRHLTVESARQHGGRLLVKFDGIGTRSEAEGLKGALYISADRLRELDAAEYWHHEIVGCRVFDPGGDEIGVVRAVVEGPVQDLLVVATGAGERLIPMVAEIVKVIDSAVGRIVVDPPEGLLE